MHTSHPSQPGSNPELEHFLALLRKFETAMLVTDGSAEGMHARPMNIAEVDDDGTLWFISSAESHKVGEIAADSRVLILLQSSSQFVSCRGRIQLVRDRGKLDELWKDGYRLWFESKDDPQIVLLCFTTEEAEYWDSAGARGIKFVYQAAKAFVEGVPVSSKMDDPKLHAKVSL